MVLKHEEIKKIVRNLSQRELETPEGTTVDLRLGEVHVIIGGEAFIEADGAAGQGKRSMFDTKLVMAYKAGAETQDKLTVRPGDYYLVKTIESVKTPLDVLSDFRPRSTLFRSGLLLVTSLGAPGYEGELIFGLYNAGPLPVSLQMGARICTAAFYRTEGQGVAYRGQHQGGRITSAGAEQQV
jgi:deoxycytidine triphosphate deaminase